MYIIYNYNNALLNVQKGATALYIASEYGHVETVQLLINAGASLDMQMSVSCYPQFTL